MSILLRECQHHESQQARKSGVQRAVELHGAQLVRPVELDPSQEMKSDCGHRSESNHKIKDGQGMKDSMQKARAWVTASLRAAKCSQLEELAGDQNVNKRYCARRDFPGLAESVEYRSTSYRRAYMTAKSTESNMSTVLK